jgi:hypothetical protein
MPGTSNVATFAAVVAAFPAASRTRKFLTKSLMTFSLYPRVFIENKI